MNARLPAHSDRAHAYLSCSSSERWLNCTIAPSLESSHTDEGSSFAMEGTKAHELAERCLRASKPASEMAGDYTSEMREFVQEYLDYVGNLAVGAEHFIVEERMDISKWVPECFGTSDAIVIRNGECHVVDLKYGKGIRVDAERNTQLMLYGLGAFDAFEFYGIEKVYLHVVQPRLDHVSEWGIFASDLLAWGDEIKPIAEMAYKGEGVAKSGDHCQFCKARHTCRARFEKNIAIAKTDFGDMPKSAELSDAELAELYPQLDSFVRWANDLQTFCLAKAEGGTKFAGLKLVAGRSLSRISNEALAIERLRTDGLDDYEFLNVKTKSQTELKKLLGAKKFADLLGDLLIKPEGKPTLVNESDPRPELSGISSAQADFN